MIHWHPVVYGNPYSGTRSRPGKVCRETENLTYSSHTT